MRFTTMFLYGLRALGVLSMEYGKGPISAKQISEIEDLSPSFLEQLLANLRKNGIIEGVRGPGGGFRLTKPPDEIRISEIIEALEGPVCVSKCLDPSNEEEAADLCERYDNCMAVPLLKKLERDLSEVLDSYKLSDMKRDET